MNLCKSRLGKGGSRTTWHPFIKLMQCSYSYEILSEAIDKMTDISTHLCQVLSLPQRDYVDGGGSNSKTNNLEDTHSPSSSSASPGAHIQCTWMHTHG